MEKKVGSAGFVVTTNKAERDRLRAEMEAQGYVTGWPAFKAWLRWVAGRVVDKVRGR